MTTEHRIDLQADKRGFGGDTMLFNGKAIGKSERPLYDAARWLLANNAAAEGDTIATYRGGTLSMHGIVGDLAKMDGRGSEAWSPEPPASTLCAVF